MQEKSTSFFDYEIKKKIHSIYAYPQLLNNLNTVQMYGKDWSGIKISLPQRSNKRNVWYEFILFIIAPATVLVLDVVCIFRCS